jgi:hypothetical protein
VFHRDDSHDLEVLSHWEAVECQAGRVVDTKSKLWYSSIYTGLESKAHIGNNGRYHEQMPKKRQNPLQKKSDILIVQLRE